MSILRGEVSRITFRNEDNHYTVLRLTPEEEADQAPFNQLSLSKEATVVGHFPHVAVGEWLELEGRWVVHPRFGHQFHATSHRKQQPVSKRGIETYLASGAVRGIGPKLARRLVAKFGEETLDIIAKQPSRLLEVEGIGRAKYDSIVRSFQDEEETREALVFLHGYGIPPGTAGKIYRQYGSETIAKVRNNPYHLADDVFGIGFKTADRIAAELGIEPDSPKRAQAALVHIMSGANGEGHVYLPEDVLLERAQQMGIPGHTAKDALDQLAQRLEVKIDDIADERAVYPGFLYKAEVEVAERLLMMSREYNPTAGSSDGLYPVDQSHPLSPEQRQAVDEALSPGAGFLVITGGPGTGKTTTLRTIVRALEDQNISYALAAPTGRAAKRLEEATDRDAKTIHRLLEFSGGDGQVPGFKRNESSPLSADVVIIDEASMIDLPLMFHLLRAIKQQAKLILVGDANQLPSVGPGNVLREILLGPTIRKVTLTRIFRQARESLIVVNAHRIQEGKLPVTGGDGSDFYFMPRDDPEESAQLIVELATSRIPRFLQCDPLSDVQVLATVRRGLLGVDNLNDLLQQALNPEKEGEASVRVGAQLFRPGDRVMQTKNDYDKMVFNGDIGRIVSIDAEQKKLTVHFPDRDDSPDVIYDSGSLNQLTLAYCISVHKSQGSEYPVVIMPVTPVMPALMHRNLLYTAMTRAKRFAVIVGSSKALKSYVRNARADHRYTALARRLGKSSVKEGHL